MKHTGKRERPTEKENSTDHKASVKERLLKRFQKPTQIYRHIAIHQATTGSPAFRRNCLSIKGKKRSSRKNEKKLSADAITSGLIKELELASESTPPKPPDDLIIRLFGFNELLHKCLGGVISVEVLLVKACYKKDMDPSDLFITYQSVGTREVKQTVPLNGLPARLPEIKIPSDSFALTNGHLVKSFKLFFHVMLLRNKMKVNGKIDGAHDVSEEPAQKKRKMTKNSSPVPKSSQSYALSFLIYDRDNKYLAMDGNYYMVVEEFDPAYSVKDWLDLMKERKGQLKLSFQDLNSKDRGALKPELFFLLKWEHSVNEQQVQPVAFPGFKKDPFGEITSNESETVVYNFQFGARQDTQQYDFTCPWCYINCLELYGLLKHLKVNHHRYQFTYVSTPDGAQIDVTLNDSFDGSYVGNPNDLTTIKNVFNLNGPSRRSNMTHCVTTKHKKEKPSLTEFLEQDESENEPSRTHISGHNRLYYHTINNLPITPEDLQEDSESENDPEWLRIKTQHMIDEFTDVNGGEKALMKKWNLHIMKYGFVGDCQIPLACSMFIEEHGKTIIEEKLCRNYLGHLSNLFDYGLISPSVINHTMRQLLKLQNDHVEKEDKDIKLFT